MKPLRVALIHYDNVRQYHRMVGFWTYEVPEFEVTHIGVKERFRYRLSEFARDFDVIVREDHRTHGSFVRDANIPVAYYVVDSTLSGGHYKARLGPAKDADLILVEHDRLSRFGGLGPPVRRFGYCVNDKLFHDYHLDKAVDVGMYCRVSGAPHRRELMDWLEAFCDERGYIFAGGKRVQIKYAQAFNRTRISVNLSRTVTNRPHRVFDAMACRTCLLTSSLPPVSGEVRTAGTHYLEFRECDDLTDTIDRVLASGEWQSIADQGHELVHKQHTWAIRARELRQVFAEEFGL